MSKINNLGYEYKELESTLKETTDSFKTRLEEIGSSLEESGIIDKCINKLKQFGSWISREFKSLVIWCKSAFSDVEDETINSNGVQYDQNGNIKTDGNIFIEDETRTPEEIKEDSKIEEQLNEQQQNEELPSDDKLNEESGNVESNIIFEGSSNEAKPQGNVPVKIDDANSAR